MPPLFRPPPLSLLSPLRFHPPPTNKKISLWLWTAVGLACLLLFCALLHLIPTYRTRLFLPNLVRESFFFEVLRGFEISCFGFFLSLVLLASHTQSEIEINPLPPSPPTPIKTVGRSPCSADGRGERERRRREGRQAPQGPPPPRPPPPLAARRFLPPVRLAGHRRHDPRRRAAGVGWARRAGADVVLQAGDAGEEGGEGGRNCSERKKETF